MKPRCSTDYGSHFGSSLTSQSQHTDRWPSLPSQLQAGKAQVSKQQLQSDWNVMIERPACDLYHLLVAHGHHHSSLHENACLARAVPIGNRDRRLPCPPRRTLSCSVSCNGSRFGRLLQVCRLATHQKTPDAAWCRSYAPQLFSRLQSG